MDYKDFEWFGEGGFMSRTFEIEGSKTKIDFITGFPGIGLEDKLPKHCEHLGVMVYSSVNLKRKYSKRRRLDFDFLGGGIESVGLSADVKTRNYEWLRSEKIFNLDSDDIILEEDIIKIILYNKQAGFLDENFDTVDLERRERGMQLVKDLTNIGMGYVGQIFQQVEDSQDTDNQILARKLERILSFDHELRLARTDYNLRPFSVVQRNRDIKFGDLVEKLKSFGVELKKEE